MNLPDLLSPTAETIMPPVSQDGAWRTSIAVRPDQLMAAESLVLRRYAWRGYRSTAEARQEAGPRVMLLAEKDGTLMGTLTVRPDSPAGLLAERTYGDEIQRLRSEGHRLGELVRLAVEEGADWKSALDALVQSAYFITHVVHSLTDVLIEVHPRHVRFYQRVFGFALAAAERVCERVGAPSTLLRLDLDHFGRRLSLAA